MAVLKRDSEAWRAAVKALLDGNILSQKEFAQQCGVSGQTVSNWLSSIRSPGVPARRRIMKLIEQSQGQVKKNRNMLLGAVTVTYSYKKQLAQIISTMTEDQSKTLLKLAKKITK